MRMMPEDIDYRLIGLLTISYMVTVIGEVLRSQPGDFMDVLIVAAVLDANNAGGETKRGVSRNAISRTLNVPLETVRRRVNSLIEKRALAEQQDGLISAYGDDLSLRNNAALNELNLQQLRELFLGLKAHGIKLD
jgi:hypothetical protein